MIRFFVQHRATTVMFVLVFVVLGVVSMSNLIIETTPKVDFPYVVVDAVYAGASPEEIETQIVKKIEDAVAEISQIKKILSYAQENFGRVFLEFEVGADPDLKSIEVKDKVDPIVNEFPEDADKPEIRKFDPLVAPILDLVLASDVHSGRDLFEYADKNLKDKLSVIRGVASVDVFGGSKRQVNVTLNPQLMQHQFIDVFTITKAMDQKNVNVPGGIVDRMNQSSPVRLLGEFETIDDIKNMTLNSLEGTTMRLRDVAHVEDGVRDIENHTRFNQSDVVGLSVKKLSDGDTVRIAQAVRKSLPELNRQLPDGMRLILAFDSSEFILSDTEKTVVNIGFGILLTVFILLIFLGDLRVTLVAAVVIPTSLISSAFLMDLSGFSINFMTLLAVATSLGTLIANALVIIETVTYHMEQGKPPEEAAVDGTKEAAVAVLASAGTNLVVFTPLAFMSGIVGQFMQQFGLTVVYATLFSLIASFSLTPMLCGWFLKPPREKNQKEPKGLRGWPARMGRASDKMLAFFIREYHTLFSFLLKRHLLSVAVCLLLIASVVYPLRFIGGEFVPQSDHNRIVTTVELPQGTLLKHTLEVAEELEAFILNRPEVESVLSYVGSEEDEKASLTINLKPAKTRALSDLDLINLFIPEAAKIPDADISFSRAESGPEDADILINVFGPDYDWIIEASQTMQIIMLETGAFRSVVSSHKRPKKEIRFRPDQNNMIRAGVDNKAVGDTLRYAISGHDKNKFKERGKEYDIQIKYDKSFVETPDDIRNISILSRDGLLPIAALGTVQETYGFSSLRRRDKERVIQISGFLSKSTSRQVQAVLDREFKKLEFPEGARYAYAGNAEFEEETNKELGGAFLVAVILTFMLLIAIMNSYAYPLVIMSAVITSFVGVFYFMFFFNFSMNVGSQMAMVMLVGLAVNNAILMLDYAVQRMKENTPVKDALWLGASVKFRTILMTSLAIVFGALPQVFDISGAKASMGGVIVGGMLGSLFFTFVLIPILFWYVTLAKTRLARLFHRA